MEVAGILAQCALDISFASALAGTGSDMEGMDAVLKVLRTGVMAG